MDANVFMCVRFFNRESVRMFLLRRIKDIDTVIAMLLCIVAWVIDIGILLGGNYI